VLVCPRGVEGDEPHSSRGGYIPPELWPQLSQDPVASWEPQSERIETPGRYILYQIRSATDGRLVVAALGGREQV
jgi:hypothetical protein